MADKPPLDDQHAARIADAVFGGLAGVTAVAVIIIGENAKPQRAVFTKNPGAAFSLREQLALVRIDTQ